MRDGIEFGVCHLQLPQVDALCHERSEESGVVQQARVFGEEKNLLFLDA